MTDGLVHHWNFDEGPDWHDSPFYSIATNTVVYDSAGTAHASFRNMGGSNWVSGRQFSALQFDGLNQSLSVPTNLATTLGATASISFWLQTKQTGAVAATSSPGLAGSAANNSVLWGWLDADGCIGLGVDGALVARCSAPINDGRWHHVAMTRDSATGMGQVYVDGGTPVSGSGPAGVKSAAFTSLGRIEGSRAGYFKGRLDQVHVFERVISTADVATLRTNHAPKAWDATTEGVNNRAFSTASVFCRAYDVENDTLKVRSWTQPTHGSITYSGDGSFIYTAKPGYVGSDSFALVVEDGMGGFHRSQSKVRVMSEPAGGGGVPVTQFNQFAAVRANGVEVSHSGWRIPRVVDWNGDGLRDLLVGAGRYVWLYLNAGTTRVPSFAAGVRVRAAGADIYAGTGSSPIAFIDVNGDGSLDLVLADSASKLRVYRNTAGAGAAPVLAAPVFVKNANGADFVLADRRFDLGDWDGDGRPDLVTGTFSGNVQLFLNTGTALEPRFGTGTVLFSDSYQLYPRLFDLNGNGLLDLLRGINWGTVFYWRDSGSRGLANPTTLSITDAGGVSPDLHALTDGPVVDFGDFDGDGKPDLVIGGHAGDRIYLALGVMKTVTESLAEIEAIYETNLANLGSALSANTNALLTAVNNANWNLISRIQNGTLGTREALFTALTNHIGKYPFLKYQALNTNTYHHVPSIVLQNWVMLQSALADTPARRTNIADVMGLSGTMRTIFLESGLALGDNAKSIPAAYGTVRDFLRRHPRELFPDAVLTIDQLYGDGRGGFVWTPNSTKNTFGDWAVGLANEWAGDLTAAIEKVLGKGSASGDYFTFVMGHEVTHSLDGYVNSRANTDLRKRWGLVLCTAAGPDVVPGVDGWWDWTATKANFRAKGYWDGAEGNWSGAWSNYWAVGAGAPFRNTSFMRGNIDWFIGAAQESLATQANHHWANGPGRLIGATDRFRRGSAAGLEPLKANINEVVTFIDFLSAGMNRVNLVETKTQSPPQQVNWFNHYADLERDDRGYIRRITVEGQMYDLQLNTNGVVTNVITGLLNAVNDTLWTFRNQPRQFAPLINDSRLEGGPVQLLALTPPAHGSVAPNPDGTVVYTPAAGYVGTDKFNYSVTSAAGGIGNATVFLEVVNPASATGNLLVEYWWNAGTGTGASDLTGNANYPNTPSVKFYTNSAFELRPNLADNYGSRCRALLNPAVGGSYTFFIASDDSSELWLSTNADCANRTLVASVSGYTGVREWGRFASQKSASVPLVAGQSYYLETVHKEGGSADHLSVAWVGPAPLNTTNVIAASYLKQPFYGFTAPRFTSDPLAKGPAVVGSTFSGSLADAVMDTNLNETQTFTRLSGPPWLGVSANGLLGGNPGYNDVGTNLFSVRVTDSTGLLDEVRVSIQVWDSAAPGISLDMVGTNVQVRVSGIVGHRYALEYAPEVWAAWQVLTQIASLPASTWLVNEPATNTRRFYRAVSTPF